MLYVHTQFTSLILRTLFYSQSFKTWKLLVLSNLNFTTYARYIKNLKCTALIHFLTL